MKKVLLTFFTIATFAIGASAQISIGAKAGLNLANLSGDIEDVDMRLSVHFGGYLNYAFSEQLSIQPELLYSSVGAKSEYTESFIEDGFDMEIEAEETMKINYISVPVMLKYSFGNFNIQAGPQLNFLASAKSKGDYKVTLDGDVMESESEEEDIKEAFKGTDFGFNFGLGADFGKLNASVRYSLGLSSIADDSDADIKNNVIQLSIGYRLFGGE